ncbi:MAG: glycerol-3-phosphate 1-O-acyltransferase PlsY [Clostridia bacterium]|nr:glycerol-3-phosphate 1-O-acyltransferase PlsY [Clostridia bacterium]
MEEITGFFSACWLQVIIAIVASYLISSVNTSIIVTGIVLHKDIRTMGSGNAGFTNVLRCVGKVPAVITFIGDFLKGIVSVLIAILLMINAGGENADIYRGYLMYIAGLFAVVGHTFPIYYKFKGGKGVVTSFAVMLMTDWRTLLCALILFAIFFLIAHIISLCAVINFSVYTLTAFLWRFLDYKGVTSSFSTLPAPTLPFVIFSAVIAFLIGVLVLVRHKDNIKRLLNGTEKKIKAKA